MLSSNVLNILQHYKAETPGTASKLARLMMHGKLGGTGRLLILPVDQGFEHGPMKSFAANPAAYDPLYHIELAMEAGLSAFCGPLGLIEAVVHKAMGSIPLILKLNHGSLMHPKHMPKDQAYIASVEDALRLGCCGVGLTVYPGSETYIDMLEEAHKVIALAKKYGLIVVLWSYPRGPDLTKEMESSVETIAYSAHMACLTGAHIVKVKLPQYNLAEDGRSYSNRKEAIKQVMVSAFNSTRLVLFSGGEGKTVDALYEEVGSIRDAGGHGSIIGRNVFQRRRDDALLMLEHIISLYKQGPDVS